MPETIGVQNLLHFYDTIVTGMPTTLLLGVWWRRIGALMTTIRLSTLYHPKCLHWPTFPWVTANRSTWRTPFHQHSFQYETCTFSNFPTKVTAWQNLDYSHKSGKTKRISRSDTLQLAYKCNFPLFCRTFLPWGQASSIHVKRYFATQTLQINL